MTQGGLFDLDEPCVAEDQLQIDSRLPEVLRHVVTEYLSESSRGLLTRGFASLNWENMIILTSTSSGQLKSILKRMEGYSFVVLGELDSVAVDIAVTAKGFGVYAGGSL